MKGDKMKEEWRPVVGYEGLYEVSDIGRIKALEKLDSLGRKRKSKLIKISDIGHRRRKYLGFKACRNGENKNIRVHQAVAQAFIGPKPKGMVVDHIDNNSKNNKVCNLQYITPRENLSKDRSGSSIYTGVAWEERRKKWCAKIRFDGKQHHLGYFDCEKKARDAYLNKLEEIDG